MTGYELYSFLNGFNGYNQVRLSPEDQENMAFVMDWGVYVVVTMMFGLKTTPATLQRAIMEIIDEFIPPVM